MSDLTSSAIDRAPSGSNLPAKNQGASAGASNCTVVHPGVDSAFDDYRGRGEDLNDLIRANLSVDIQ